MQNSGKQEEIACRFCHQSLPPWPYALLSCESANVCAAESDRDSAKHATSSTSIDVRGMQGNLQPISACLACCLLRDARDLLTSAHLPNLLPESLATCAGSV